jgi:murein DD-endopeptidase MepM/ murein hydrolase activator NlpD
MKPGILNTRCRFGMTVITALLTCSGVARGDGPEDDARGKISSNFYRIPYLNETGVTITRDYVDHGVSQGGSSSDAGKMDMVGGGATLVAAADGEVIFVNDAGSDCGCDATYGGCANGMIIRHANGELSKYVHIAQGSAAFYGITTTGIMVAQGASIALEGDVGYTCGNGRSATAGTCLLSVPAGAGKCGVHLHWEVYRESTGEYLNPMICNIGNNIFSDGGTYTAGACVSDPDHCQDNASLSASAFDGFGTFEVVQANDTITADTVSVENLASLVLHAGNKVTLQPGFQVIAEAYFRAEIGSCNATAPTP